MEITPRVAVDASHLDHTASVNVTAQRSKEVIDLIAAMIGPAMAIQDVAQTVKVSGPGWSIVSVDEADRLSAQQRNNLVPIRSRSSLAMVTKWSPGALTLELLDEGGAVVALVEPDFEARELDITDKTSESAAIFVGTFEMVDCASKLCLVEQFKLLLSIRSPIRSIPPAACGRVAAMGKDAGATAFGMPSWVGDIAVRWLSQCLRVHVIHHASLPNGVSRPLTLNGVYLNKVMGGRASRWRLSMIVHESSCRCFCNAWRKNRSDMMSLGTPKRVSISMEFCGCDKIDNYCPHHPETPGRRHRNPAVCDVCTRGVVMQMSCRHAAAGQSIKCPTQLTLPCKDMFAEALLCVCRSLSKMPSEECESELMEFLDTSLAETMLDYATTRSLNDDTMIERDMIVAAMLETGQYFFGQKRKHAPSVLQQRNVSKTVPVYLSETMATHSHLLPRS